MSSPKVIFPKVNITGERSIRFAFSNQVGTEIFELVQRFCDMLEKESLLIEEVVPSYHTVTVYLKKDLEKKESFIQSMLAKWESYSKGKAIRTARMLHIPVCYSEEFALDMERMMKHTGLGEREIISLHTESVYTVYMIGFLPGFPYLGELNPKLITPRLATPRGKVSKGTVGIGGSQTGIYPIDCPGGWNIIGKTPIELYRPDRVEPFFIRAGDSLQFAEASPAEFFTIQKQLERHPASINEFIIEC